MTSVSVPTILYHYTSPAGLLGILESESLWASNIHYLNDANEFKQATDCASQILYSESKELEKDRRNELVKRFTERLNRISNVSILVSSFSENGDSLSQWRGYCPSGGGYAVGFEHGLLGVLANQQKFKLLPCTYSHAEHQLLLKPLITPLLSVSLSNLDNALNTFLSKFVQVAPMIKHPSFHEEREWRIVSELFANNRTDWKVRVGRTMLIPYTNFKLGKENDSSIREIIVGPTQHQKLSISSVCSALNKFKIKNCSVRASESPFREW